jgi:hypothetical protein
MEEDEDLENFNSISKMMPTEMRSFIAPSLSTMPTRSMIVIPIRFGFTSKTHVTWRSQPRTKEALESNNVTASFPIPRAPVVPQ